MYEVGKTYKLALGPKPPNLPDGWRGRHYREHDIRAGRSWQGLSATMAGAGSSSGLGGSFSGQPVVFKSWMALSALFATIARTICFKVRASNAARRSDML